MRSTTYTCDRCGRSLDISRDGVRVRLDPIHVIRGGTHPLPAPDLCAQCVKLFEKWLNPVLEP